MKRSWMMVALGTAFAVLLTASAPAHAAGVKDSWKQGSEALQKKRYFEAIDQLSTAIKQNTGEISIEDISRVFNDRGQAYLAQQQYTEALADFDNAIRLGGSKAAFHNNRGLALYFLRRDEEALDAFSKAVTLAPIEASYAVNRGKVHLRRQNPDQAILDFDRAIASDPRMEAAYLNRGIAYKSKAQFDKALESLTKALEIDPADSTAAYQKAAIFSITGKVDVACAWIEIAGDKGFRDWNLVKNSGDFDGIRKSDCYRSIMQGK